MSPLSGGMQVTLCDPMMIQHVSSSSGETCVAAAVPARLLYFTHQSATTRPKPRTTAPPRSEDSRIAAVVHIGPRVVYQFVSRASLLVEAT